MNSYDILYALGEIDNDSIKSAKEPEHKKRVVLKWAALTAACLALTVIITAVTVMLLGSPPITSLPGELQTYNTPASFASLAEYEQYVKSKSLGPLQYHVPQVSSDEYVIADITTRDGGYLSIRYDAVEKAGDYESGTYEAERMNTLICQCSFFDDAEADLQNNYIKKGFKEFEYNGKKYYRFDEHADNNNPEMPAIGYEIAFIENGQVIYMHLPAVDTFENMMAYTNVAKVIIE